MDNRTRQAARAVASRVAKDLAGTSVLGLGSGSTVAAVLEELAPLILQRNTPIFGVSTSTQIEEVASRSGIKLVPFSGSVDFVLDGADQVDAELNLIKGGGGALLKEKILMSSAARTAIVASEKKFANRLCENGVRVPVETLTMAREGVKVKLSKLGGMPEERLLPNGYPFFTENGNVILDTAFEPIDEPGRLESEVKNIPGVLEVGIFTIKPITVYRLKGDGSFDVLE
jgi:ribose 5-phosphate isomerase A